MQEFFAVAAPGLEPVVAAELRALGHAGAEDVGGVRFQAPYGALVSLNRQLRVGSRILMRFASFRCVHLSELVRLTRRLPWGDVLKPNARVRIKATCRKSKIYHSGAAAQRVREGIEQVVRLGAPVKNDPEGSETETQPGVQEIVVRIEHDMVELSINSSGEHLHRRGYKLETAKAPLRETLAAGLLQLCDWSPDESLIDPMCGSGTFVIEAARQAAGLQPGSARGFACEAWPVIRKQVRNAKTAECRASAKMLRKIFKVPTAAKAKPTKPPVGKSQNATSQSGTSQSGTSQSGTSQSGTSQNVTSQVGTSQSATKSQSDMLRSVTSQVDTSATSQTATSQLGTSQIATSQSGTSQSGTSQSGTSQSGTSQSGTSQSGTSQSGTSQSGTSQSGTSQSGTSQSGTSQNSKLAPTIHAYDRDAGAVASTQRNAERAGVAASLAANCQAIKALRRPDGAPGLVIVNPPWGERVGDRHALRNLYASIGHMMRTEMKGWRLGLVTSQPMLAHATELEFTSVSEPLLHGGVRIRLYRFDPQPQ